MNVLYIISNLRNGIGGHNYSLKITSEALKENTAVVPFILEVGNLPSPILKHLNHYKFFYYNYFGSQKLIEKIKEIIAEHNIKILHAYDHYSFSLVESINVPLVTTKCGGKNGKRYLHCKDLIVFSTENWEYSKKYVPNVHYAPNRVLKPIQNQDRINNLRKKLNLSSDKRVFLKISRIGGYYEKSIKQAINLIKKLNETGQKNKLLIIGTINDQTIFRKLKSQQDENILFVTDEEFTSNASELIDISDIYIGTGRGIMEAAGLKKILLVATSTNQYPALLTKENFPEALKVNFSERYNPESSDEEILHLIDNNLEKSGNLFEFYDEMFKKYFDVNSITYKYVQIYTLLIENHKSKLNYKRRTKSLLYLNYSFLMMRNPKILKVVNGVKSLKKILS